jgi:hypothetical protein
MTEDQLMESVRNFTGEIPGEMTAVYYGDLLMILTMAGVLDDEPTTEICRRCYECLPEDERQRPEPGTGKQASDADADTE